MKVYIRKIDKQCIEKQMSYTKEILREFLGDLSDHGKIVCEGKNTKEKVTVTLLLATDPRFDNNIQRLLKMEGELAIGDLMVMYKVGSKYIVELIKPSDARHASYSELFGNDRHVLLETEVLGLEDKYGEAFNQHIINIDTISEDDFRKWLSQQTKANGELLSEEYQNAYYYILKAIPCMLGFTSVFEITNTDVFAKYREEVENSPQYKESNPNIGVGTLSAALTKYGKYLEERNPINITKENLAQILKEWCSKKYVENNITSTLVGFGFKYARALDKANVSARAIMDLAQIESTMQAYIDRGKDLYYAMEKASIGFELAPAQQKSSQEVKPFDYSITAGSSVNRILFGMPGCGKSYYIEHDILGKDNNTKEYVGDYSKERVIRTTFYQDYSNTDFVGQILPKVVKGTNGEKDTVEYIFNPGPFTLALIQAISNPTKKVALVIEEINRGNAPAIFGDIFQLLDRDVNSISEYGIVNVGMMDYLNSYEFEVDKGNAQVSHIDAQNAFVFKFGKEKKRYHFDEIKIPGNMDIFATMNTSDQNVYTLDTAFVRRWDKVKIKNSFKNCKFKDMPVPGMTQYTWEEFVTSINNWIAKHLEDLQVNEDKQIGAFFVKASLLAENDAEKFAYKVFDYLWSDVAKLDHGIFFNPYDTLEELIDAYKANGVGVFKTGIFEARASVSVEEEENNE